MSESTAQAAKKIRVALKESFPKLKFSVKCAPPFSMGEAITVSIMKASEQILKIGDYHNTNEYLLNQSYEEYLISTKGFLTEYGFNTVKEVYRVIGKVYSYDTRFSFLDVNVGQWDKPFVVVP